MLNANPTYRTLLAVDIERSAGRGDVALLDNREVLFDALRESCVESGIDWDSCHRDSSGGDAIRLVAGPEIPKTQFVHPLMRSLALRLRAHNRTAGPLTTIRVRAALHAGDVHLSDGQFAGGSLETLARLLEAPPLRASLRNAPALVTVALIVSEHIHESVVRHGYVGIDPETYRQVPFTVKESALTGWLHVPDGVPSGTDPAPGNGQTPPTRGRRVPLDPDSRGTVINATNVAAGNAHVRDQIGHRGDRIDHVVGDVYRGTAARPASDLRARIAEVHRSILDLHTSCQIDKDTYAAAETELRRADAYATATDQDARRKLVIALRKVKGLVEDITDLAAKVAAVISAARGA